MKEKSTKKIFFRYSISYDCFFCQSVFMSRLSETLAQRLFCHRTALRLYGVIKG